MQFLKVSVLMVVLAGCSTANVPAARPPAESTQPPPRHNPVETALVEAAGVQYGAYAELLGMLSNEGATPLLSLEVDLGTAAPNWAMANYRRLIELTDRMVAAEAEFQEAVTAMSGQTGLPNPGKAAPRNAVGWNLQLLSLMPVMQTGLLQTDLLHSGWKFWKWGENARRSARATVLGVAFADAQKHQLQAPEQAMMRRRVYEVARTRYADRGDIGRSEREFYENLRDGKLDHIAQRLHADMSQDASDAGMSYMTITGVQGKRPIDIVYEEGCRGLAAGVDLYMAAGKRGVAGGLGPEAGKKFTEGYDKGVEIVEKIQEAETRFEQFREVVRDPIGYAKEKAPKVIQQRAVELLKDKTGLSDEVIEECTDQLGEAVQQVVQNAEVSRRIDEAYERDQFLAELAKERGDQPAPGESVPEGPAGEAIRLRRITEQVHEEMAADGWNLNTLRIDLGEAADALRDRARTSLDSMVAWWNDAQAGATRLTILPTPVASGTTVALPAGVQTELIELADSGAIHRLTDRPVVVSDRGVTQVAIEPPPVESPPERIVMGDHDVPAPRPDVPAPIENRPLPPDVPRPSPMPDPPSLPAKVAKWPNPAVFFPRGKVQLHKRAIAAVHPTSGPVALDDSRPAALDGSTEDSFVLPAWRGKAAWQQQVMGMAHAPFGRARIWMRPLAPDEHHKGLDQLRIQGKGWERMQSFSEDGAIHYAKGNLGYAMVSAGGYLAVVVEFGPRYGGLAGETRRAFYETLRDRMRRAGQQD